VSLRSQATPVVVAVDRLIDDVLLRTLEPTIAAVERLLDSVRSGADPEGDPDGYDGVDRVGGLENLLPSEWLVGLDLPDEFLRRYEHRELAYFKSTRSRPRRPLSSLALFDVGPAQLGRPRIVHLAVLVVLARRASTMGSTMRWGTLQHPGRHDLDTSTGPARLVAERSLQAPSELPLDAFVDDCLVVSPLPGPPYVARQLVLEDAGDEVLATVIDRRAGVHRQAQIPVPHPDEAVRILRDPTASAAPTTGRVQMPPRSNLVFDQHGHKLLARVADDRLAIYPVPNSPKDQSGRIRSVRCPEQEGVIAAAGRVSRSVLTVNIIDNGQSVVVRRFGGNVTAPTGTYRIAGGVVDPPTGTTGLGSLSWVNGKLHVHFKEHQLVQEHDCYRLTGGDATLRAGRPGFDASATPTENGDWIIRFGREEWFHRGPLWGVHLRQSATPAGFESTVCVVGLDDDNRSVVSTDSMGRSETIYVSPETVADGAFHSPSSTYALRTKTGRVIVRSLLYEPTLYDLVPR
jgi:hypothetical protein